MEIDSKYFMESISRESSRARLVKPVFSINISSVCEFYNEEIFGSPREVQKLSGMVLKRIPDISVKYTLESSESCEFLTFFFCCCRKQVLQCVEM